MANNIIQELAYATPAERLKYIRKKARLTRDYLVKKHGLSSATLKAWENGVSPLTEKGLQRCIDMYRSEGIIISKEWVQTGEGLPPTMSLNIGEYLASDLQYPIRREKKEQKICEAEQLYQADDTARMLAEANHFKESYPHAVVIIITNDDMEPVYQIGDMVGGIFRYEDDIASVVKRDCVVRLLDGSDLIRRVFKSNVGPFYNLACINPLPNTCEPILFNVEIKAAAPIMWHRMPDPD